MDIELILHHPDVTDEFTFHLFSTLMEKDYQSPKDADPKLLWVLLRTKYKDGDEMVDSNGLIWDVWRKDDGFALYCAETKEALEIPKPKL